MKSPPSGMSMSQWPETPAAPAPSEASLNDALSALVASALRDGQFEIEKAEHNSGILRLNISLAVRHGRKQGASTSLVFERKLGS